METESVVEKLLNRIQEEREQHEGRVKLLQEQHDDEIYLLEDKLRMTWFYVAILVVSLFILVLVPDADLKEFFNFIVEKIQSGYNRI